MDGSKRSQHTSQVLDGRWLDIEEVRLVSDLRIMHSKVNELYEVVKSLQSRHSKSAIEKYADAPLLEQDIHRVDEIYLWFIGLKNQE